MTDKVLTLAPHRVPADLAATLRRIADAVDAGEVTQVVMARIQNEVYEFTFGASMTESLVLASLLQTVAIDRIRQPLEISQ